MGKKKIVKKGKKKHVNNPTSKKYSKYKIEGGKIKRELRFCPKCGPGIFLAHAENRVYCGKCHYTSFDKEEVSRSSK